MNPPKSGQDDVGLLQPGFDVRESGFRSMMQISLSPGSVVASDQNAGPVQMLRLYEAFLQLDLHNLERSKTSDQNPGPLS